MRTRAFFLFALALPFVGWKGGFALVAAPPAAAATTGLSGTDPGAPSPGPADAPLSDDLATLTAAVRS